MKVPIHVFPSVLNAILQINSTLDTSADTNSREEVGLPLCVKMLKVCMTFQSMFINNFSYPISLTVNRE